MFLKQEKSIITAPVNARKMILSSKEKQEILNGQSILRKMFDKNIKKVLYWLKLR